MFTSNLNESKAILAVRFANPYDPADYAGYHTQFARLVAAARTHQRRVVLIVDLEDGYPQANAVQRKDIGEAWGKVPDLGGVIAILTTSVLIRGVITAIEWFMKNSPNRRETRAFASSAEAVPWIATHSGLAPSDISPVIQAVRTKRVVEHAP